jgi:hypothetical protein
MKIMRMCCAAITPLLPVIAKPPIAELQSDTVCQVAFYPNRPLAKKIMPTSNYLKPEIRLSIFALLLIGAAASGADSAKQIPATGTFRPDGPPRQQPVRVDAGQGCVVDVQQSYIVKGTLSGAFDIDFRILVTGPCGSPAGTFAEEWIAHGNFVGSLEGETATAKFTYTATVEPGGEISGRIVLGQGLHGELHIRGSFSDGVLTYDGQVTVQAQD